MTNETTAESICPYLDALKQGGAAARGALLARSQERLARMVRRALRKFPGVGRWEDASDVLQNVLVRLDRALREVFPPTPADFLALASAHIRWELTDLARRHNGPHGVNDLYLTPPTDEDGSRRPVNPPAPADDPLGIALWQEFHARIQQMPDGPRRLFDALFYRGLTQDAAAAFLGIPLRTLRRRWQDARERLMREFGAGLEF